MINENISDETSSYAAKRRKPAKKITPQRLKNVGLFYLKRFESSVSNLRGVLQKKVNTYAHENPDFNREQALGWVEDVLAEFERLHYLDDARFAEIKIRSYLEAGKPARYIQNKLREKGVAEKLINDLLQQQEYNPEEMALKLAKRKKIGPFHKDEEERRLCRQKDMGTLIRAGFDYDVVCKVLAYNPEDDEIY